MLHRWPRCFPTWLCPNESATLEHEAPPLLDIVRRAADYVRDFTAAAAVLVADEHYVQQVKAKTTSTSISPGGAIGVTVEQRVLDSEVALVQVLDRQLWMIARDVLKVDNHALPDAERVPLSTYHPASMADALSYFQQLATNSARFNIGRITRNLNVPTLALWFLSEPVQGRFSYALGTEENVEGRSCRIVEYRERARPYLLNAEGRSVPVRGRFWIESSSGAVLKTELLLADEDSRQVRRDPGARALITVRYTYAKAVDAWVPLEMTERYDYPGRTNGGVIVGRAD